MISLFLESPTDSLDLGALLDGAEGVQAIKGLTGAGLPPVSVQWSEGAGNGSTYRGQRVLPRDIDIPLFISSESRAGLLGLVKRLAMILADEATLRLVDDAINTWTLKVVRTGGGDFIYGVDTDGERDLGLTITLRAGQPFWSRVVTHSASKTSFTGSSMSITNPGSMATPPQWTVIGPGQNLVITSPKGEKLTWNGTLANGELIEIDAATGTVINDPIWGGASRYAELAPAPRFASVEPGTSDWQIQFPTIPTGILRTNLCVNPNASVDTSGWTATTATLLRFTSGSYGFSLAPTGTSGKMSMTHPNITVVAGDAFTTSYSLPTTDHLPQITYKFLDSGGVWFASSAGGQVGATTAVRIKHSATVPAGAVTMQVVLEFVNPIAQSVARPTIQDVLIEKTPSQKAYFDGATTDTSNMVYAWTGTTGKSTSTLTVTPDRTGAIVQCSMNPREWMVL